MSSTSVTSIHDVPYLDGREAAELSAVTERFAFHANEYYLSLIEWDNPRDPLRRLIVPSTDEIEPWGREDASLECNYTCMPGVQHKYPTTVLLLVTNRCAGLCRYCFRKRIFSAESREMLTDVEAACNYIRQHREITNVLLTGGDPLTLPTERLESLLSRLAQIRHVKIVRIGSKVPAFDPYRIIDDPALVDMLSRYADCGKGLYLITHFDHPNELTAAAKTAISILRHAGVVMANQTPLIRGINDDPDTLALLLRSLSFVGVVPYYIFQCRPVRGNRAYAVPIEEGYEIVERAKAKVSGLAKRARFVMSHAKGKIEVVGLTAEHAFFKYHRAAREADSGRFMTFRRNAEAYWIDDYEEVVCDYPADEPYRMYGPE